jgi:hypothetical protein
MFRWIASSIMKHMHGQCLAENDLIDLPMSLFCVWYGMEPDMATITMFGEESFSGMKNMS